MHHGLAVSRVSNSGISALSGFVMGMLWKRIDQDVLLGVRECRDESETSVSASNVETTSGQQASTSSTHGGACHDGQSPLLLFLLHGLAFFFVAFVPPVHPSRPA